MEKPQLKGTALKPQAENMSEYCRSSSSRNKITLEEIKDILSSRGQTAIYGKKHQCFNAGKTEFDNHKEYVFITKAGTNNGK